MKTALRIAIFVAAVFASPAWPCRAAELPFFSSYPALDLTRWYVSDGWANGDYQACEWRTDALSAADHMLIMTLAAPGGKLRVYGCPEIHTQQVTGYGRYEVRMRTAAGGGLNTAFFTYTGPPLGVPAHDEIDFEFLGKTPRAVEVTQWAGTRKGTPVDIDLGFDASAGFHDYVFDWTKNSVRWYVDGKLVHSSAPGDPMPSHPGDLYLSLWAGAPEKDDWLGHFTYTKPVTAAVAWVKFTPAP